MNTVFVDVDTQIDFLFPAGALHVPGGERILSAIARLNRYAAGHGIPVLSTMDAHAEDDLEFRDWPPHCVAGTAGQQKVAATLLERRIVIPNVPGNTPDPGAVQQILVEKQTLDCFNVHLASLLAKLAADRYVVYGVVTEICVKFVALRLLNTGKRVELVTDAIRSLDDEQAARTLEELHQSGCILTTLDAVTAQ